MASFQDLQNQLEQTKLFKLLQRGGRRAQQTGRGAIDLLQGLPTSPGEIFSPSSSPEQTQARKVKQEKVNSDGSKEIFTEETKPAGQVLNQGPSAPQSQALGPQGGVPDELISALSQQQGATPQEDVDVAAPQQGFDLAGLLATQANPAGAIGRGFTDLADVIRGKRPPAIPKNALQEGIVGAIAKQELVKGGFDTLEDALQAGIDAGFDEESIQITTDANGKFRVSIKPQRSLFGSDDATTEQLKKIFDLEGDEDFESVEAAANAGKKIGDIVTINGQKRKLQ